MKAFLLGLAIGTAGTLAGVSLGDWLIKSSIDQHDLVAIVAGLHTDLAACRDTIRIKQGFINQWHIETNP